MSYRLTRCLSALAAGWLFSMACSQTGVVPGTGASGSKGGGGDGGDGGPGGDGGDGGAVDANETLAACRAYCDRLRGTSCDAPPYSSAEVCQSIECASLESVPPVCLPSAKAYYDCGRTRADICRGAADGCPAELGTYQDCISVLQCPIDQPVGGCSDPNEGTCYQSSVGYQCDHATAKWRCPTGTQPAPVHDCSAAASPDAGSGGDDRMTVTESCNAYCDRLGTKGCDMGPYTSVQMCKSIECASLEPIPDICLPSAKAYYDCARTRADVCTGAADGCPPQLKTYEDCEQGIGTLQCPSPRPQGSCSLPSQGTCYHDPLEYECDTLRGIWECPFGTSPAPGTYNCAGSGGDDGGAGGSHP